MIRFTYTTNPTLGSGADGGSKVLIYGEPANTFTKDCRTVAQERGATPPVNQTATAMAGDKSGQSLHPIPTTDSTLEQYAEL